jgi:sulfide dehydrogenase [flavocytochrome c] flavoprotein chain
MTAMTARRRFIQQTLALTTSLGVARLARAGARPKVVIVGAGYGGATCARYLKLWEPRVEVTVIEPNARFYSCPMSNTVLAGMNRLGDISFPYEYLRKTVDRFAADTVIAIDPVKRRVRTAAGAEFSYDRLVLAPGIELLFDRIEGYDIEARKLVMHAWKAGPDQTVIGGLAPAIGGHARWRRLRGRRAHGAIALSTGAL